MIQEFKDFINRGNVMDLAVAVVLAAAFTPIVTAVVERVIMPIIGLLFGTPNFDNVLTFADGEGSIGAVITALVSFLLVAFAVFLVVKAYNSMQAEKEKEEAGPSEVDLLTEIRDELRSGQSRN